MGEGPYGSFLDLYHVYCGEGEETETHRIYMDMYHEGFIEVDPVDGMLIAQQQVEEADGAAPCSQPEASQFDFWLGEWELEWADGGKGTNVIEKVLDGCVIAEQFDGTPSIRLRGRSVSTYNTRSGGKWQQTWVDNQGGYLDFSGGFDGSKMVLKRQAVIGGEEFLQRMVWYDIAEDSLRWNWERSDDGGETWRTLWEIRYTRKR